jgi:hypothetical protein
MSVKTAKRTATDLIGRVSKAAGNVRCFQFACGESNDVIGDLMVAGRAAEVIMGALDHVMDNAGPSDLAFLASEAHDIVARIQQAVWRAVGMGDGDDADEAVCYNAIQRIRSLGQEAERKLGNLQVALQIQ